MFTGIISHLGKLKKVKQSRYTFFAPKSLLKKLKKGGSIAVNGVCLTVVSLGKTTFSVDVMPETIKKTSLGDLKPGDYVNLERPVSARGLFEGHIVLGHIDQTGTIVSIRKQGNSWIFRFKAPPSVLKYLVNKGSVAINGISLTVIKTEKDSFTVGIIPHTWKKTMLHFAKPGDRVNIEVDILAKHIKKFLKG
ncbi:MAG: riboflavin synthase [Candidatus Aminicenantes bacterium]|nr:MAG: riboflavin synthase [Candidatus Aminicenantes bacterium]